MLGSLAGKLDVTSREVTGADCHTCEHITLDSLKLTILAWSNNASCEV